jgi:PAS domain S-box-containing protein
VAGDRLDCAPCWFVSFNDGGKVEYANTTFLERLGYSRDEVIGNHIEKFLATGSRIFYQTHFFPLVKLHGRAQEVFILLRASNGESVGALCNAQRDETSGQTECVFMEVKERRKFEEALVEARKIAENAVSQLEKQAVELELQSEELQTLNEDLESQRQRADDANRAKSNFLATMSHELRTPLNAIGGYVQLLEMGVHGAVTDAQLEALGRINRSQKHLLRLINDILNLARIEAGRVEYDIQRIVISDVVAGVMPMVDPQMLRKDIQFTTDVAADLIARADLEKVQQILLNLLTNAIKFTATKGSIEVAAGRQKSAAVFIRVSDTGVGIPKDMLEKVFEPFMQVPGSNSRAAEGTGLGLAISRDLARGMGGDLTAASKVGEGSTFELILPAG